MLGFKTPSILFGKSKGLAESLILPGENEGSTEPLILLSKNTMV